MSKNKPRKHNKLQQIQENLTNKDGRNKDGKERVVIKRRLDVKINLRDGIKIRTINNKRRDRRPRNNSNKSHNLKENGEMISNNNKNRSQFRSNKSKSKSQVNSKKSNRNGIKNNKKVVTTLVGKESNNNKSQKKAQSKGKDMKTKRISNKINGKVERQESMRTEEASRTRANGEATNTIVKNIQRMKNYDKYHITLFRNPTIKYIKYIQQSKISIT